MKENNRYLLVISILLMLCMNSYAISLRDAFVSASIDSTSIVDLNPYLKVYHTPDTLSAKEAYQHIYSDWEPLDEQVNPGMDYPDDVYWLNFSLKNTSPKVSKFYIEIDFPQIDFIQLYAIDSVPKLLLETGDQFPFSKRPLPFRNFLLPVTLDENSNQEFLLLLDKRFSTMRFPMTVFHENFLTTRISKSQFKYSIFFSFLLLVVVLSLILGILLRQKAFAAYAFYVLSFGMWFFTSRGLTYQLITSEYPEFNKHFLPFCSQLAIFALVIYIQQFFQTSKYLPKFHSIMNVILLIFLGGFIFWGIFPDGFVQYASVLFPINFSLTIMVVIFTIFSAIFYYRIDRLRSVMFLTAYALFFLGIFVQVFSELGIIDASALPLDPIFTGYLLEVFILSIAMSIILRNMLLGSKVLQEKNSQLNEEVETYINKEQNQQAGYITLSSKAVLKLDEIKYISADDHYLEYHLMDAKQKEIDRHTLSAIEKELPSNFVRIHRSTIVNIDFVKALYSEKLTLIEGTELKVSRKYKPNIQSLVK
ncbi:MAG: LytTR family transcriptional regulator DNA-binding domain-containing protein [Cyclobacteriaceae bacterium]